MVLLNSYLDEDKVVMIISSMVYILLAILSILHFVYYISRSFAWGKCESVPESGVKGLMIVLENRIKLLSFQSVLGLLAILVIAFNNAWFAISGGTHNEWVGHALRFFFGVGIEKGVILRLGFISLYWGLVIIFSIILSEKAKSQLQMLWVLKNELKLEMPGYFINGQQMGVKGLVISILVIMALLAFMVLFPYLF